MITHGKKIITLTWEAQAHTRHNSTTFGRRLPLHSHYITPGLVSHYRSHSPSNLHGPYCTSKGMCFTISVTTPRIIVGLHVLVEQGAPVFLICLSGLIARPWQELLLVSFVLRLRLSKYSSSLFLSDVYVLL